MKFVRRPGTRDPLQKYMDGGLYVLTPGVDYTIKTTSFRSALWRCATGMELKVSTRMHDGKLYIQATSHWGRPLRPDLP